jgi:hypothetical protein
MIMELIGFRWQIVTASGEADGLPYRYLCRCLDRVRWMNLVEGPDSYTLKPIRVRE